MLNRCSVDTLGAIAIRVNRPEIVDSGKIQPYESGLMKRGEIAVVWQESAALQILSDDTGGHYLARAGVLFQQPGIAWTCAEKNRFPSRSAIDVEVSSNVFGETMLEESSCAQGPDFLCAIKVDHNGMFELGPSGQGTQGLDHYCYAQGVITRTNAVRGRVEVGIEQERFLAATWKSSDNIGRSVDKWRKRPGGGLEPMHAARVLKLDLYAWNRLQLFGQHLCRPSMRSRSIGAHSNLVTQASDDVHGAFGGKVVGIFN
jgi:hypothetical protein